MTPEEKRKFIASKLDYAKHLGELLLEHGELLPSVDGKESNKSEVLKHLIGPNRKLDLSKDSEGMRRLLAHSDDRIRKLAEAKQATQSWPLHIQRVINLTNFAGARGGRIGIPVAYSAAHTHRNGGCEGVNFYNFPKRPRKGFELLKDIKGCIVAPKGMVLLSFDFSQVEARRLAHLAGQDDLVTAFSEGRDVYSEFATKLFRKTVRKPDKHDPPPVYHFMDTRRQFGKKCILGCGYGMGHSRFYGSCLEDDSLRDMITPILAKDIVTLYRETYSKIPKFWKDVENAFKIVWRYPEEEFTVNGIRFSNDKVRGRIVITLPSGSKLFYPEVRKSASSNNLRWKYSTKDVWGGDFTENIVQSDCRDMLVDAILRLKENDYTIVADVYDSITVLVEEDTADVAEQRIKQLLRVVPEWCTGMPLCADDCERSTCIK